MKTNMKRNLPDKGGEKGFTLVEVMMAMAIFSVGFMAVAGMQLSSGFLNRQSHDVSEAVRLAADTVEMLMREPYGRQPDGTPVMSALLVDTNGDGVPGMDATWAGGDDAALLPRTDRIIAPVDADHIIHSTPGNHHTVFWNVRDMDLNGDGVFDFKQINIIVVWPEAPRGIPRRVEYNMARGIDV